MPLGKITVPSQYVSALEDNRAGESCPSAGRLLEKGQLGWNNSFFR